MMIASLHHLKLTKKFKNEIAYMSKTLNFKCSWDSLQSIPIAKEVRLNKPHHKKNIIILFLINLHKNIFSDFRITKIEIKNNSLLNINKLKHSFSSGFHKKTQSTSNWTDIKKEELLELVWTKPSSMLALDLGVSDSSIRKKCKKMSISKPPRGFWEKVYAGLIKHPNGTPHPLDHLK